MARVTVAEPMTGVELQVEDDSPQAKTWGKSSSSTSQKSGTKSTSKSTSSTRKSSK